LGDLRGLHNGPAPEDYFPLVEHRGLAGGDGPLGLVEFDAELVLSGLLRQGRLFRL
jgi:hypothetical protein